MTAHKVDYTKLFEVQTVPKIHGEPDYESLTRLKDILKANASRITSELGGGAHGHLGLILAPQEYANVSPTPYNRPAHPGNLIIPSGTAQHAATTMREMHQQAKNLYHETIDLDNALKKQITDTIDDVYLVDLRDATTNTIVHSIPQIFAHLFNAYGDVTSETLKEKEQGVRNMTYSMTDPLSKIYQEIEDLQKLGEASIPYTQDQLMDIALGIIKRTGDFQIGLQDWYKLPRNGRTWLALKAHFQQARNNLKQVRGPTMQAAGFGAVNNLSQEVQQLSNKISRLQTAQSTVLEAVADNQTVLSTVANHLSTTSREPGETVTVSTIGEHSLNVVTQNRDIMRIVQQLQQELAQLRSQQQNIQTQQAGGFTQTNNIGPPPGFQAQTGRGRGRQNGRSGNRRYRQRRNRNQGQQQMQQQQNFLQNFLPTQTIPVQFQNRNSQQNTGISAGRFVPLYCWTHGICGHSSANCEAPAPGHQVAATFQNMMGGNTYNYGYVRRNRPL